jgi:hypothetical protein
MTPDIRECLIFQQWARDNPHLFLSSDDAPSGFGLVESLQDIVATSKRERNGSELRTE